MKLIGISCVRDEEDVIESFVRHNLVYLDKIYIIDNLSKDKTAEILAALVQEGLPIEVWQSTSCSNQQELAITAALNKVAQLDAQADFAFLLDADEFLGASNREALIADLAHISAGAYGRLPWKTYVPVEEDLEHLDPSLPATARMTHRRSQEGYQMFKAVVPKALLGKVRALPGSHVLRRLDGGACMKCELSTPLAHFPIRSAAQLVAKIILCSHSARIKKDALPDESFHWQQMAASIRHANYRVTTDHIRRYTMAYSVRPTDEVPTDWVCDPLPAHAAVSIRYPAEAENSLLRRFDHYIIRLQENNHITPVRESEFDKRAFHLVGEMRASFKQCKRWVKRRFGATSQGNR